LHRDAVKNWRWEIPASHDAVAVAATLPPAVMQNELRQIIRAAVRQAQPAPGG